LDLTALSTLLTAIASIFSLLFVILQIRGFKKEVATYKPLAENIASLLRYEESEDGQPLLDVRLVKMVDALSSGIAKSLKMSFLGGLSGNARLEKGLKGAIAQDVIEKKAPIINLVGDFLGFNTQKYVAKHPDALISLVQRFAPQLSQLSLGGTNPASKKSTSGESFKIG
jgi:hypothetical protein